MSYGFSETDYDFSLNRNGLLYATHPETNEVTQLDLSDISGDNISKVGDTDLVIELNPRRPDEPPRIEGKQLLHFGSKTLRKHWDQKLRQMLQAIGEHRQRVVVIMQKWARVGMAKREFASKKRNMLIHDRKKVGSGKKADSTTHWQKPYAQLKLKTKPQLVTINNRSRMPLKLVGPAGLDSGSFWQEPPAKVTERDTGSWGSFAKRPTSGNEGCTLYRGDQVDVFIAFCRPGAGVPGMTKEWTAGALYTTGEAPPIETVFKNLENSNSKGSPRAESNTENTAKHSGLVLVSSLRNDDFPLKNGNFLLERGPFCTENDGFMQEWNGDVEGVADFVLCSDREYRDICQAREDEAEAAALDAIAATARGEHEVIEELIQMQVRFIRQMKILMVENDDLSTENDDFSAETR